MINIKLQLINLFYQLQVNTLRIFSKTPKLKSKQQQSLNINKKDESSKDINKKNNNSGKSNIDNNINNSNIKSNNHVNTNTTNIGQGNQKLLLTQPKMVNKENQYADNKIIRATANWQQKWLFEHFY